MILRSPSVDPVQWERATGWALKPEGACRGDVCLPLERWELPDLATRLGLAVVHDAEAGLWSVGPEAAPHLPAGNDAPEFDLPDLDGRRHRLNDQRGRKVLVLAWAPW